MNLNDDATVGFIAMEFARFRTGCSVFMDGSHNPSRGEVWAARKLARMLEVLTNGTNELESGAREAYENIARYHEVPMNSKPYEDLQEQWIADLKRRIAELQDELAELERHKNGQPHAPTPRRDQRG